MLCSLLTVMGESDTSLSLLKALLREIANTVSGNARTKFGADFIISPPTVLDGTPEYAHLPKDKRSYVIAFQWQGHEAIIGICVWSLFYVTSAFKGQVYDF